MNKTNTGGQAFPRPFSVDDTDTDISYPAHTGMTLRDYFAAKAMQSLTVTFLQKGLDLADPIDWMDGLAGDAYRMADSMLKARES